jgi:hypothetical protein
MKTTIRTSTLPAGLPLNFYFAIAAVALALLAIPQFAHAQGLVRGAGRPRRQSGYRPVGGLVGGAVGAGVGARWAP